MTNTVLATKPIASVASVKRRRGGWRAGAGIEGGTFFLVFSASLPHPRLRQQCRLLGFPCAVVR